jgi:2'-5' RNA ligase
LLAEGSPDQRRGLTVIAQPSTNVRRHVNAFLDRLRQIEPDQHYYAPTEFHITVLSLFTATEEHERFFAHAGDYKAAVATALNRTAPLQIEFVGVTASPAAIMIQGFFDTEALNEARDALREELRLRGLTEGVDGRYRLETAHMTVARFRAPLRDSQRFLAALEESRLLPLGMTRVQSVKLVKNDWFMTHRVLEVVERYALPSTHSGT